ncbi:MAG: hypothetical protein OXC18_07395 [Desulfurellaceae bacterium]|nr:hypothetical protein [Desulfurellaceae bacterium]
MMNFKSDLEQIIKEQFDINDISYEANMDVGRLAARYFEMLNRLIVPSPRNVVFSEEIHDSLGRLARETEAEEREKVLEAWRAIFLIRLLLEEGKNVNGFLSTRIKSATGEKSKDGLLWDFGMHHFHLSTKYESSGFVERSGYLLYAVITQEGAYFVDIGPHRDPRGQGREWVRQDLLRIVHSNWPELIESHVLRGLTGSVLTDEEKWNLRKKNANHVTDLGGKAVLPIGGGTTSDGSSLACRMWASRLLHEIDHQQRYFDEHQGEVRSQLEASGTKIAVELDFQLVLLDSLNPPTALSDSLREDRCLSRDLCRMGFVIVETTTRWPIVLFDRRVIP